MEAFFSHQKSPKHTITATSQYNKRKFIEIPTRQQMSEFHEMVESQGFEALCNKACDFHFH